MDEKKKLKILEKTKEVLLVESEKIQAKPKISHPNQTNPIAKKLVRFSNNNKERFSLKDLLR